MQGRATSFELSSSSVEAFGEFSWRVDLVVGVSLDTSKIKQVYANWFNYC